MVSWTRLLSGEWRDPLVARDALIGCMFGGFILLMHSLRIFVPSWLGHSPQARPGMVSFETTQGIRFFMSELLGKLPEYIGGVLLLICLFLLLKVLLRNQIAVAGIFILIIALGSGPGNIYELAICLIVGALHFLVLMRFGLVALLLSSPGLQSYIYLPTTLDTSAWYSGFGFAALAIYGGIVLCAFRFSLGGRPLISAPHLDD